MTAIGCLARARRKFHELRDNHKSVLAEEALRFFGALYDIERIAMNLETEERLRFRKMESKPIAL